MAVIKFDKDKANTLIRDLNRIASDIESNLRRVHTNTSGKEISLYSSLLKVYDFRTITESVLQEDGTYVDETRTEQYLKYDYTSYARTYNNYIRSILNRSTSASSKATKAIREVVSALVKLKSLVSDFESDTSLRMASSLDDVGQFDFNFLSAYGAMSGTSGIAALLGAKIADEAFTSRYLGPLGARPTALNLDRLVIFDGILDLVNNNELTYEDKIQSIEGLLMGNVLEVDKEALHSRALAAYESMLGIANGENITLDENLKVNFLVDNGVNVVEDFPYAEWVTEVIDGNSHGDRNGAKTLFDVATGIGTMVGDASDGEFNINDYIVEQDGQRGLDLDKDGVIDFPYDESLFGSGHAEAVVPEDVEGNSPILDMVTEAGEAIIGRVDSQNDSTVPGDMKETVSTAAGLIGGIVANAPTGNTEKSQQLGDQLTELLTKPFDSPGPETSAPSVVESMAESVADTIKEVVEQAPQVQDGNRGHGGPGHGDGPKDKVPDKVEVKVEAKAPAPVNSSGPGKDFIKHEEIELPQLNEKVELTPEEIKIEEELKASTIDPTYDTSDVSVSGTIKEVTIELPETAEGKGAAVIAGAAGVGSLGTLASNSAGGNAPTINGLAAGEMINMNTSINNDVMAGGVMNEISGTSSVGSAPTVSKVSNSSVGGESTADRGSLKSAPTTEKTTTAAKTAAGRGGSTLEDKDPSDNENSYGKPNKTEDVEDNNKKGMLGDASIAELNEKDEKQIKIATGVSAGGALGSAVLAFAGILPSFMFILLLLAIIALYTTYRVKKKHDKKKRMEALAAQQAEAAAVEEKVVIDTVQNVEETPVETAVTETVSTNEVQPVETQIEENVAVQQQEVQQSTTSSNNEFSEQPYEPSRDGVVEIGTHRND